MQWRSVITYRTRRLVRRIRQSLAPTVLDAPAILAALRSLPENRRPTVMVHSSLSACGKMRGGAAAVIAALRDWTKNETLAMPAHTYCYPDEKGHCGLFDPATTPSLVGAITDAFWREPDVLRSLHPTHSLAATGPGASQLVAGHEYAGTPCGAETPYQKLVNEDAGVLMFGVTLNSYTLFHTAEALASVPYLYCAQPVDLRVRIRDGTTREMRMWRQDMNVRRLFADMDSWLEQRGLLHRLRCGNGELLWLPHSQAVHRELMQALRVDPWFLVAEESRAHVALPSSSR